MGCEGKISFLIDALKDIWANDDTRCHKFVDLGCGDGRVVLDVCSAFPNCQGIGVDLNAAIVEKAVARAKSRGLGGQCDFRVCDMIGVDLSEASVIFLYLP